MQSAINLGLAASLAAAASLCAGELPLNKWTRIETKAESGYVWSGPVWAPTRGQLLHWGGQEAGKPSRNDVRAFDAAAGDWGSDYESDPPAGATGSSYGGVGSMLKSGRPRPYHVIQGGCWDSRRGQVVYTMKGLMAAYDPKARSWTNLQARTAMPHPFCYYEDKTAAIRTAVAGGPPVYGVGTCYDPVNDEIVLFPHFDAKNVSLRAATGQITGHYGTFRYSFASNLWTLVSDTFGSSEIRAARRDVAEAMNKVSTAMDAAWSLRRKPDSEWRARGAALLDAAANLATSPRAAPAREALKALPALLAEAAAAFKAGRFDASLAPLRDALWLLNATLDGVLRVEPPARSAAPMIYDPKSQCIVMFGGQTTVARTDIGAGLKYSGLDDTWLYDCKSRQWREVPAPNRPPRTRIPLMGYDPVSGLVLLVTIQGRPSVATLWTFDAATGAWSKRHEEPFPAAVATRSGQGSEGPKAHMPATMGGFDPRARLFLVMQPEQEGLATYALKVDLDKLPPQPAPPADPAPPIVPRAPDLADDPAWVAKLKALPANTWVAAKPPSEPSRRDWGIISVDPARGCLVYFGGGHSSYQCNDVAIYAVGGNQWSTGVGDHNGHVPNNEWEGSTLGHRGGPPTGHQRNTYQSFDGRLYLFYGANDRPGNYVFHAEPDYARFYDLNRGGVWRDLKIDRIARPEIWPSGCHVSLSDPRGRLFTILHETPGYYAPNVSRYFINILDLDTNSLELREVPKPFPEQRGLGEGRPYCYLPDRDQIFLMNGKPEDPAQAFSTDQKKSPLKQVTFLYDVKSNSFGELRARATPPVRPVQVVEYCAPQKCALAIIGNQQWVYSFEKGDWAELPLVSEPGRVSFQAPYGQMVWVEKYGVFVNFAGRTWVMRPDFSKAPWQ